MVFACAASKGPVRPRRHKIHGTLNGRSYIQFAGIEQVSVCGLAQGRFGPAAVAGVAGQNVGKDARLRHITAGILQLQKAAAGADLRCSSHKQLCVRMRRNHGSDITPVQHCAGGLGGKSLLIGQQRLPDGVQRGNAGSSIRGGGIAQSRIAQCAWIDCRSKLPQPGLIFKGNAIAQSSQPDCAV